jgi:hypothetical protein
MHAAEYPLSAYFACPKLNFGGMPSPTLYAGLMCRGLEKLLQERSSSDGPNFLAGRALLPKHSEFNTSLTSNIRWIPRARYLYYNKYNYPSRWSVFLVTCERSARTIIPT